MDSGKWLQIVRLNRVWSWKAGSETGDKLMIKPYVRRNVSQKNSC